MYGLNKDNLKIELEELFNSKDSNTKSNLMENCLKDIPQEFITQFRKYNKINNSISTNKYLSSLESSKKQIINAYIKSLNLKTSIYGIMTAILSTNINKIVS